MNSTAVVVQWYFSGDSSRVVSYTIQIQPVANPNGWTEFSQPGQATTEKTIAGLTPYTRYNVQVVANYETDRATSEVFRPSEDAEESIRTPEDKPGSAPVEVKADSLSSLSVFVQWEVSQ